MLSRLIPKSSSHQFRRFGFFSISSNFNSSCAKTRTHCPNLTKNSSNSFTFIPRPSFRFFSSDHFDDNGNNGRRQLPQDFDSSWNFSSENTGERKFGNLFHDDKTGEDESLAGIMDDSALSVEDSWLETKGLDNQNEDDLFKSDTGQNYEYGTIPTHDDEFKAWKLDEQEKPMDDLFAVDVEETAEETIKPKVEPLSAEEAQKLEMEEKQLTAVMKGPDRAFGDLITASGITDEMLDSLIALKDFEGIEGLPPLSEIEDMRYEKNTRKNTRAEIELQKQEEIAKARVRQVDDKGRAYGTGRRKCSVARVWVQPGDGKFVINDKEFDVYFPMLDHRAALLRPFVETKTLGLWDVKCTVKGGGVSGQVGAIRLGISRALQNWEPDLRPPLRAAGFLTRDSRVVERKKPGKAKARKSFQWVKR